MQIIDIKEKDSNKRIDIFLKEKTKLSRSYISKLLNKKLLKIIICTQIVNKKYEYDKSSEFKG